jgi:hypothetical protein
LSTIRLDRRLLTAGGTTATPSERARCVVARLVLTAEGRPIED